MKSTLNAFEDVNIPVLRERAYNLRWATLPDGVIPLTAADPDFCAPPHIGEAISRYVGKNLYSYGPAEGLPVFRESVANFFSQKRNLPTTADHVVATNSAANAMYIAVRYILKPGEEAIVFDPVDFLFRKTVEMAGGKAVRFRYTGEKQLNADELAACITDKTRLICLCNPHNPLGKNFSREELIQIANLAEMYDLQILSDEIWSDIVFDGKPFISIASLAPEVASRTYTVYGFSKSYGLAGLRIGALRLPDESTTRKIVQHAELKSTVFGVATLSQVAAVAALDECGNWLVALLDHLTRMRDLALTELDKVPGISCKTPEATFLLFPRIDLPGVSSIEIADFLMREAKVAVVPGGKEWFGPGSEGHFRISFASSEVILREALKRVSQAMQKGL